MLRDGLRQDLGAAIKSRQPERISVLRTMIAAIDNAEAVQPEPDASPPSSGVIAHASAGVGSTEAPRRALTMTDVHAVLRKLLCEYQTHQQHYRAIQQPEAAERLRHKADILRGYLDA